MSTAYKLINQTNQVMYFSDVQGNTYLEIAPFGRLPVVKVTSEMLRLYDLPGHPLLIEPDPYAATASTVQLEDVNTIRTVVNSSLVDFVPGMPLYGVAGSGFYPAIGNSVGKNVIALYLGPGLLAPGGNGLAQFDKTVVLPASSWQAVTDEVGGLITGGKYYLHLDVPGKMTRSINRTNPAPLSYQVCVGYALSETEFKIEIQSPVIRLA